MFLVSRLWWGSQLNYLLYGLPWLLLLCCEKADWLRFCNLIGPRITYAYSWPLWPDPFSWLHKWGLTPSHFDEAMTSSKMVQLPCAFGQSFCITEKLTICHCHFTERQGYCLSAMPRLLYQSKKISEQCLLPFLVREKVGAELKPYTMTTCAIHTLSTKKWLAWTTKITPTGWCSAPSIQPTSIDF